MLKRSHFRGAARLAPLLLVPLFLADCGVDPLSLGEAHAGAANAATSDAGSNSAGSNSRAGSSSGSAGSSSHAGSSGADSTGTGGGGNGGTSAICALAECGPAPGVANSQCPDGTIAGPTGRCLKHADGSCGWEIVTCPIGTGGSAGVGAGGQSGELCGGQVCAADQVCCGPAACGRCINKLTGPNCPAECTGGSGGTSAGGASGAGGGDCASLLTNLQTTLAAAQSCLVASDPPEQCQGTIEGLCCPVAVAAGSDPNNAANAAYLSVLKVYKQSCAHVCSTLACIKPALGCVALGGSTKGNCSGGDGM